MGKFVNVGSEFLGNNKDNYYEKIVKDLIINYYAIGCLMSLKIQFLDSHLGYFLENLGDYSEEQGERFHQDIKEMERRYQGFWDNHMMADYCWNLKRETSGKHKGRAMRRSIKKKCETIKEACKD